MHHDQPATKRTRHHRAVFWQRDLQRKYLKHLCSDGASKFIGGDHLFTVVVIARFWFLKLRNAWSRLAVPLQIPSAYSM